MLCASEISNIRRPEKDLSILHMAPLEVKSGLLDFSKFSFHHCCLNNFQRFQLI